MTPHHTMVNSTWMQIGRTHVHCIQNCLWMHPLLHPTEIWNRYWAVKWVHMVWSGFPPLSRSGWVVCNILVLSDTWLDLHITLPSYLYFFCQPTLWPLIFLSTRTGKHTQCEIYAWSHRQWKAQDVSTGVGLLQLDLVIFLLWPLPSIEVWEQHW